MHIIIALLIICLIYIFIQTQKKSDSAQSEREVAKSLSEEFSAKLFGQKVAYISKGKLFYRPQGDEVNQIHSAYIQGVIDRVEKSKKIHGWKENTSFGTSFAGRGNKAVSDKVKIQVTSAQFDRDNRLVYFLKDEGFGGLFGYDIESKKEQRLVHKHNLFFHDLNLNPENGEVICSQQASTGVANIALFSSDGSDFNELTGGDTVDSAPTWIPGNDNQILFQSSGIAREQEGYVVAYGPASIQMLDKDSRVLTSILEDPNYDFLQPRVNTEGNLYFIRRPYEMQKYKAEQLFTDILFFPFRMLRAVFHYLNFFSLMYSRKPLTSASGPQVQADIKEIIVKGKKIDAQNALRKESSIKGVPSLVPRAWQLVCRNKQGQEKVLATNVASFDITVAGDIVYTNGCGVFLLDENQSYLILRDKLIEDVIVQ